VVAQLMAKELHLVEPGVEEAVRDHIGKNWTVSSDYPFSPDVVIICVSTPVGPGGLPDLTNVRDAANAFVGHVTDATLVIVRSTVPVGTTRDLIAPLLETGGTRVALAFCPERTIQGIALREIVELPQVVGARDERSLTKATEFFSGFVKSVVSVSSLEAAELVKLVNNCHTDLIYSYGNVVALMALEKRLDPLEVIEAANRDYPRPNLARPGFVGGACLTKDPYILTESFVGTDGEPFLVREVRRLNESMPQRVAAHFSRLLLGAGKDPASARVLVCGFAYKGVPETDDMRGTPVTSFLEHLVPVWKNVSGHDFVVDQSQIVACGVPSVALEVAMVDVDGVIFLNDHPRYSELPLERLLPRGKSVVIYDCWRLFRGSAAIAQPNIVYAGIGYER